MENSTYYAISNGIFLENKHLTKCFYTISDALIYAIWNYGDTFSIHSIDAEHIDNSNQSTELLYVPSIYISDKVLLNISDEVLGNEYDGEYGNVQWEFVPSILKNQIYKNYVVRVSRVMNKLISNPGEIEQLIVDDRSKKIFIPYVNLANMPYSVINSQVVYKANLMMHIARFSYREHFDHVKNTIFQITYDSGNSMVNELKDYYLAL